ncbi:unnamed protein product [Cochlearia groenlandica]
MLQAHELELEEIKKSKDTKPKITESKSIALSSQKIKNQEICEDDPISLLYRKFNRALRKVSQGQHCGNSSNSPKDQDESKDKKANMQCHECKGYGHFKRECPTTKKREIKCFACKGFGHTQAECPNKRENSMMGIEEEFDEDSDDEEINNFVARLGIT